MTIPRLGIDPFCRQFFDDPFPAHVALRDAGPVADFARYGAFAVARYDNVQAMLGDWQSFSSQRGVGLSDFAREKPWRLPGLLLKQDPPLHDRTRKVMDGVISPAAVPALRAAFARAADTLIDELLQRERFDAVCDLAEACPLTVFPDAVGMPRENAAFCCLMATWCSTALVRATISLTRRCRMQPGCWHGCRRSPNERRCRRMAWARPSTGRLTPAM